jgi:4,5-DOPA dioxygenase extradiol
MTESAQVAVASGTALLVKSERLPVLFVGHGSPMNAIEDNEFRRSWQGLGQEFGARWPKPRLILCISAHWLTTGWQVTAMEAPRTIHDFGGFPQELFDEQYPAPGSPGMAAEVSRTVVDPPVTLDQEWGLDHGSWSILKPMFPQADIPVIQLSMDYPQPAARHFSIGRQLSGLRERGVLIVGSGNIVHNLRAMRWGAPANQAYEWAAEFDGKIAQALEQGDMETVQDFQALGNIAQLAHPTYDHYLPLLYAAGAAAPGEQPRFFNTNFQGASISMRSVIWG